MFIVCTVLRSKHVRVSNTRHRTQYNNNSNVIRRRVTAAAPCTYREKLLRKYERRRSFGGAVLQTDERRIIAFFLKQDVHARAFYRHAHIYIYIFLPLFDDKKKRNVLNEIKPPRRYNAPCNTFGEEKGVYIKRKSQRSDSGKYETKNNIKRTVLLLLYI